MKLFARKLMRGRIAVTFAGKLLSFLLRVFAAASLAAGIYFAAAEKNYYAAGVLAAIRPLFIISAADWSFYCSARRFYEVNGGGNRPGGVFTVKNAIRYFTVRSAITVRKLAWGLLFFFPAVVTGIAAYLTGDKNDPVYTAVLTGASAVLALAGAVFYFTAGSRYYLADYILYANPLIPPAAAVRASVECTDGKLVFITVRRLSFAGWYLSCLFIATLPFVLTYGAYYKAVFEIKLFGERKVRPGRIPVVFYIDSRSKIIPSPEHV